jgi:hypothetical protein
VFGPRHRLWRDPGPGPTVVESMRLLRLDKVRSAAARTRSRVVGPAAVTAAILVVLLVAHGASAAGWSEGFVPKPPGSRGSALNSVSCTSPKFCVAVGSSTTRATSLLVEVWKGTKWSIAGTPSLRSTSSTLNGVSCTSRMFCVAVGSFTAAQRQLALVEFWDGSKWSVRLIPTPFRPPDSALNGVSCTSRSACTAVGWVGDGPDYEGLPLAARWNGSTWLVHLTRNVRAGQFSAVSCTSTMACVAVGDWGGVYNELTGHWNGRRWSVQAPFTEGSIYSGVSCISDRYCIAVGFVNACCGGLLASEWNGTQWLDAGDVTYQAGEDLSSVSSSSEAACTAVGYLGPGPLVLLWDGASWSPVPFPVRGGLSSVSCTSNTTCVAVGQGRRGALAARYSEP